MNDLRWFAPNRYCTLPVPGLREAGLTIDPDGDGPARLVVIADGSMVRQGFGYARRHRVPWLVYLWDIKPWEVGGGRPDLVLPIGRFLGKLPRIVGGYPERSGYWSRLRFMARRAVEVWCPSSEAVGAVRARFGVAAVEVPFCYDSDRFSAAAGRVLQSPNARPVILSVSRLVDYKNHAAVIRAAARLGGSPLVRLIGQGPEESALRALARERGVELQLDEHQVSDDEVVDAYRHAAVVVCPSRFEGFGLTPMEGLAMGIPVVASDIGPHREFVSRWVRLFPVNDEDRLVEQLAAALSGDQRGQPEQVESPIPGLGIEACVARFLPQLERLLARSRLP